MKPLVKKKASALTYQVAENLSSVIPGRCEASNYDVQLHIGESRDSGFARFARTPE
jgi:hypothetical protein